MADKRYMDADVLEALATREARKTAFGYGIRTAACHVGPVLECMDDAMCSALKMGGLTFDPSVTIKQAEQRLVYSNEEMLYDKETIQTSADEIDKMCKAAGVEPPPRTIMVFENLITTPKKDRDGDILRTEGAKPDPAMPLLWQHMPAMPIGKMLKVLNHTKKELRVLSAVIDTELGNDTAALIEFGALRISHGFRALKIERLPEDDDGYAGLDVLEFEVMEESTVSVPSNTEAVITAFSRGKLASPLAKRWAKGIADQRPTQVPGADLGEQDKGAAGEGDDAADGDSGDQKAPCEVEDCDGPLQTLGAVTLALNAYCENTGEDSVLRACEKAILEVLDKHARPFILCDEREPGDVFVRYREGAELDGFAVCNDGGCVKQSPELLKGVLEDAGLLGETKRGRVLSKSNEDAIRAACDDIEKADGRLRAVLESMGEEEEEDDERTATVDAKQALVLGLLRDDITPGDLEFIAATAARAIADRQKERDRKRRKQRQRQLRKLASRRKRK